jgi:hypothetical protein
LFTSDRITEDLLHGQVVIIVARWILVLAGLLLAMWNPDSLAELRIEILVLLCLAVVNFYLHLHLLVRRQSLPLVVYAASAIDLAIVTLLVAVQGGYSSHLYIFYFPALLGLAVAFPTALTALYTAGAAAAYAALGLATAGGVDGTQDVAVRLLILVAVAVCGNLYLRIEADRRAEPEAGLARIESAGPAPVMRSAAHESGVA